MTQAAAVATTREQFLRDILCTAVEGGIGYWALAWKDAVRTPNLEYVTAFVCPEDEQDRELTIDADVLERGILRILNGDVQVRSDLLAQVAKGHAGNDGCEIDAEGADVIVQAGLFSDIVYG